MESRKNLFTVLGEWWDSRHVVSNNAEHSDGPDSDTKRITRLRHWLTPNGGTLILVLLLILTQSIWAGPGSAPQNAVSSSATTINYQGRLADSGGTPINDTVSLSFSIYDATTGGSLIWGPETHSAVSVSDGLFNVGLGSQTAGGIPTTVWNGDRYLEISVDGEALAPREMIRSVPIAGMALTVPDGSITAEKIAGEAVQEVNVLRHNDLTITQSDQKIVTGWGYMKGTDQPYIQERVNFDTAFEEAPIVLVSILSANNTDQQPTTSISDFDRTWYGGDGVFIVTRNISTTGFDVRMVRDATFGSLIDYGYSWIAIGK